MNLKDMAQTFVEGMKPRIGTALMRGERARVGRPTDNAIFVTGGNFPDKKQIYVHFVTDGDVTSVAESLVGSYTPKELTYERPVLVKKNDAGFYYIAELDPAEDAIYSEGIEELDDQLPVHNRQLIEQATIHPIAGALQIQVSSGLIGEYYFSGQASGVFSTGTVQDTTPANITAPTTNGKAKGILIQIDAATETLEYKQSAEFAGVLSLQQAYKAGLLPTVDNGKTLRGYLKWSKGATQFTYADIWNVGSIASSGAAAPVDATYIVQTANATLTNEQVLASLATGILKNTTTTGVLSIATANTDYLTPDAVVNTLTLNDGSELTIASGAITVTKAWHTVDTEADAASDDLDTVNGLAAGEWCLIKANNSARTVVVKHGTGNITCLGTDDLRIDDAIKVVLFIGDANGTDVTAYPIGWNSFVFTGDAGAPITVDAGDTIAVVGTTGITTTTNGIPFGIKISVTSDVTRNNATQTLTNKTIDADDNTVSNIGAAEVKADLISGATEITSVDTANDFLHIWDATDSLLKKVKPSNLGISATVVAANKVYKFAANQDTTSTTMVDVDATNAAITATLTGGGKCLVTMTFRAIKNTAASGFLRLTDGTNHSDEVEIIFELGATTVMLQWTFDTSAGSTTYKLQYRSSNANTMRIQAGQSVVMTLKETA